MCAQLNQMSLASDGSLGRWRFKCRSNVIPLAKVGTPAQQSKIGGCRCASFRNRDDVIELEVYPCSTLYALAAIPPPHLRLYRFWYGLSDCLLEGQRCFRGVLRAGRTCKS